MASSKRMYRLLQGDVGCGKTIVALYALLYTVAAGFQGALMVPTEVLAEQHFLGIDKYVEQLGVSVDFLTGSLGKGKRTVPRVTAKWHNRYYYWHPCSAAG